MAMANHHQESRHASRNRRLDVVSLAVLFVAIVAIALSLVGVAERGTSPLVLIAPLLVGCAAIIGLLR
jgi:uncharacterized membrane protein